MKCNRKPMIIAGVAFMATLGAAYAVWPPVRALVLGVGPYLLFLVCPLMMWLMMRSISAHDDLVSAMTEGAQKSKPASNQNVTGPSEAAHASRTPAQEPTKTRDRA